MQKNVIILFAAVFLLIFFKGIAQTSFPFPTENAVWTEVQLIITSTSPPLKTDTISVHYGTTGDTTINGALYKKIFTSSDSIFTFNNQDLSYYGAIKSQNNKTYFIPRLPTGRTEYIIYDANFQVGDTLYNGGIETFTNGTLIVKSIDSIQVEDNSIRKRWNFERIYSFTDGTEIRRDYAFSWIEGIGNTKCPFVEPVSCAFFTSEANQLLCFENNKNKIYRDSQYLNCYYKTIVGIQEQKNTLNLNIFPNPTNQLLTIESKELILEGALVCIFDLNGKLLISQKMSNKTNCVDISHLSTGTYALTIDVKNGYVIRKIIKM